MAELKFVHSVQPGTPGAATPEYCTTMSTGYSGPHGQMSLGMIAPPTEVR